jgi:hypothetical protein
VEIPIADIKAGMILRRSLSQGGQVILNEGAILSPTITETLRRRGIRKVDVLNDETGAAPGGNVLGLVSGGLQDNPEYVRDHAEVERLFASVRPDDSQMTLLKYCVLGQLEESYRDGKQG